MSRMLVTLNFDLIDSECVAAPQPQSVSSLGLLSAMIAVFADSGTEHCREEDEPPPARPGPDSRDPGPDRGVRGAISSPGLLWITLGSAG